nr:protein longifolia 2 [Tanacetum cinerariifolium]
ESTLLVREDESHDPEYSGPISVLDDGIYMDDSPSPVKHMQKTHKESKKAILKPDFVLFLK